MNKPYSQGSGVIIDGVRMSPAVSARIEWIGKMSDKRKEYVEKRDIEGLRRLAGEYAAHNMLRTANNIYIEIARMECK